MNELLFKVNSIIKSYKGYSDVSVCYDRGNVVSLSVSIHKGDKIYVFDFEDDINEDLRELRNCCGAVTLNDRERFFTEE